MVEAIKTYTRSIIILIVSIGPCRLSLEAAHSYHNDAGMLLQLLFGLW